MAEFIQNIGKWIRLIDFDDNYALSNWVPGAGLAYRGGSVKRLNFKPDLYDWAQDFTIEFKFTRNSLPYLYPALFTIVASAGNFFRILIYNSTAIQIQSRVNGSNTILKYVAYEVGIVNHVIISFKHGVYCNIFINGVKISVTTNVIFPAIQSTSTAGWLGLGLDNNNYPLDGFQYDNRIYIGYAASDLDAAAMYNGGVRTDATAEMQPFLKSDWRLNQVNGEKALDRGILKNHGFFTNYTALELLKNGGFWVSRN